MFATTLFAVLFVALVLPGSLAEDKLFLNGETEFFKFLTPLFEYYDPASVNHTYDTKFRRDKADQFVRIVGSVISTKDYAKWADYCSVTRIDIATYLHNNKTLIYFPYSDKAPKSGDVTLGYAMITDGPRGCGAKRRIVIRGYPKGKPQVDTEYHHYLENFSTRPLPSSSDLIHDCVYVW